MLGIFEDGAFGQPSQHLAETDRDLGCRQSEAEAVWRSREGCVVVVTEALGGIVAVDTLVSVGAAVVSPAVLCGPSRQPDCSNG